MHHVPLRAAPLALALVTLAVGCGSSPAPDAGSPDAFASPDASLDDAPTAACGSLGTAACDSCLAASCCDTTAACAADEDCAACIAGESERCEVNETTHARAVAALECFGGACATDCVGVTEGPDCTTVFSGECGTCLATNCCEAVSNCASNATCLECVTEGDESVCHSEADAHSLAHALWACAGTSCNTECYGE